MGCNMAPSTTASKNSATTPGNELRVNESAARPQSGGPLHAPDPARNTTQNTSSRLGTMLTRVKYRPITDDRPPNDDATDGAVMSLSTCPVESHAVRPDTGTSHPQWARREP